MPRSMDRQRIQQRTPDAATNSKTESIRNVGIVNSIPSDLLITLICSQVLRANARNILVVDLRAVQCEGHSQRQRCHSRAVFARLERLFICLPKSSMRASGTAIESW